MSLGVAMVSQSGSSVPPTGGPPEGTQEVVIRCPVPALILAVPSARVVAANVLARDLLSASEDIVGQVFESFTEDSPTTALDLLVAGRLNGYEANRLLRLRDGSTVPARVWVRAIGKEIPPRFALAVLMAGHRPAGVHCAFPAEINAVIGTTDANLVIDRVSSDVGPLFGLSAGELIGRPIFHLVHHDDLGRLMTALAHALSTGNGVALEVRLEETGGRSDPCQLLLSPMVPVPSFAFVLLEAEGHYESASAEFEASFWNMRRGIQAIGTSRDLAELSAQVPRLSELSSRELEVVTMLLAGDRVPTIARSLFLAQSTVRNHLSSVFKKLGVGSQQELVELLRKKGGGEVVTAPPPRRATGQVHLPPRRLETRADRP
ncbi:MAG: LuxR C-terminal-related transcriptional regulator [Acidimicrobiales bacterium]